MAPVWVGGCNSLAGLSRCQTVPEQFMNSSRALRVNYGPAFTPRTSVVVQYRVYFLEIKNKTNKTKKKQPPPNNNKQLHCYYFFTQSSVSKKILFVSCPPPPLFETKLIHKKPEVCHGIFSPKSPLPF